MATNDQDQRLPTKGKRPKLKRELGLFDVFAISTGAMFSSGFFLLPGLAAAHAGPSVVLAYLIAGVLAVPAMLSKAELCTAMPRAGGTYYFLDRSLGPMVGTIGGLGTWLALLLKTAFALAGMGVYLSLFVDASFELLAVTLTFAFAVVNVIGAKESSGMQRLMVVVLIAILGFFTVQGLFEVGSRGFGHVLRKQFVPFFAFGAEGLIATVGLVFVSYAGLTKVASVSEEVERPDRNIPLGMMLSLGTATLFYVVGVFIMVAVLDPHELRSDLTPVATAAAAFFDWLPGKAGLALVVIAAVAAFASTANAGIMSASRYLLAMGRDGMVWRRFAELGRFHTPTLAVVVSSGLVGMLLVLLDVEGLAKLASAFQLLIFAFINLAVIVMRESRLISYDPGFRSPCYPWVQIVGLLSPFFLIAEMGHLAILFTVALVGLCLAWYFAYVRRRVVRGGALMHWFERLGRQRFEGLKSELRSIMKEKGPRQEDPFDELVARAPVLDLGNRPVTLTEVMDDVATRLSVQENLDAETIAAGFRQAAETGSMPVAAGVMLPHLKIPGLPAATLVLVRAQAGISVPSLGGPVSELVYAAFFLLSPAEQPRQHLRILAELAERADGEDFAQRWRLALNEQVLKEILLRDAHFMSLTVSSEDSTRRLIGVAIRDMGKPPGCLVAILRRQEQKMVPRGNTVLEEGDRLTIIGQPKEVALLHAEYQRRTIPPE